MQEPVPRSLASGHLPVANLSIDGHYMRTQSSREAVGKFVDEFRGLLGTSEAWSFDLWQTDKNNAFHLDSGFIKDDAAAIIQRLRVEDYSWGPEADDSASRPPGDVWLFWAEYEGYELYVKLKLEKAVAGQPTSAVCMSLHEPEYEIPRPYRRQRGGKR